MRIIIIILLLLFIVDEYHDKRTYRIKHISDNYTEIARLPKGYLIGDTIMYKSGDFKVMDTLSDD